MNRLFVSLAALVLAACAQSPTTESGEATMAETKQKVETMAKKVDEARLAGVLAAQPEDARARYAFRRPQQTLEFFGIAPGMTVVEALPGGGWYSKILVDYLGSEGQLVGVDYEFSMWPKFGFFSDEAIEAKKTWVQDWTADASKWGGADSATVSAFVFGSMPADMAGTADAVLFVRAMHNLSRFQNDGGYMTTAIDDAWRALRPGGIVGIVQHEARAAMPDAWADGSRGYLKKSAVIQAMEARGFELVAQSDMNENPKDQPTESDIVWRLPPSLVTSREDEALRAEMTAIGESNRMTLKFRKPAS